MEKKNNILISIIIPVFNAEKYIERCLKSIEEQNYQEYEVIIIDDGSTDTSASICNTFHSKDNRFTVFQIENQGVSNARNLGIEKAQGKYILFVDSDDWLKKNALETFSQKISLEDDLIISSYYDVIDTNYIPKIFTTEEKRYRGEKIKEYVSNDFMKISTPWAKLYKTSIIKDHNLTFRKNIKYGEDLIFNMEYIDKCNTLLVIQDCLYYYQIMSLGNAQSKYFKDMAEYKIQGYKAVYHIISGYYSKSKLSLIFLGTGIGHYGKYIECKKSCDGIVKLVNFFADNIKYSDLIVEFGKVKGMIIHKKLGKLLYLIIRLKRILKR